NVDDQVLIPLTTLQKQLSNPRSAKGFANVSQIVVTATSSKTIPAAKAEITQVLTQRHRTVDFSVQTQDDQVAAQTSTTQVLTILLGAVAGISLVVGGIGVMNIMVVSVTERTREIGIRKALGATQRQILLQFLIEAVTLCALGGLVGIGVGVGGASALKSLMSWNEQVVPATVAIAFLFAALVGIIFGVWPARRAARLDPIIALRYE
ncbi:MAG TPA: FtsX-like permease family protein, partial [Gemmatimonadaceae bacterium]|nr:FtsX-like permease family protein [Gemmatimonadaceae bacterium]